MSFVRDITGIAAGFLLAFSPAGAQALPGTHLLRTEGDLAALMVEGIDRYLSRELAASVSARPASPNRDRLRTIIGLVDERAPFAAPALDVKFGQSARAARGAGYSVYRVRWPVLPGVEGEGLLLEPLRTPVAGVVALPDADWSPEMLAGLEPGVAPAAQTARRLAESGCRVLVPVLIDRRDTWSGNPRIKKLTNQPHREFLYRMSYQMGRHIIGYEVQKVLAAVDWLAREPARRRRVGVAGVGEGGLLALYSAALDPRIDAALVTGYFGPRENVWREPIYRNVWGMLREFGDAEIAGLIAPRALVVEPAGAPEVAGPPPETKERRGAAPGSIATPRSSDVRAEVERARPAFEKYGAGDNLLLAGGADALPAFARRLGVRLGETTANPATVAPADPERMHRQFDQLVAYTQTLLLRSESVRRRFWESASLESHRRYLWEEIIGKLPPPSEPLLAQTRKVYDEPRWTGYEVVLPVWRDVFAYGILLLPKDLKPGERRPVVVCQHGLEGRPRDVIEAKSEKVYRRFAAQLAGRGFVVYAPQNPYIGEEKFRVLLRKAHPLKLSLFSFIAGQHERTLDWLASLPFVDPARIGFYGLSYGGKTAMRVPALLTRYALSICSADFNEWIGKVVTVEQPFSYMFTREYDMLEFNLGNTLNYGDMAMLIAPRPFMVERGHADGVGIDEWVASEYARVRRAYASLGIPDKTEIAFFNGPHRIDGERTFPFLHRWLSWPAPE
ncbi:MAG: alpha/beta hydrolase family protein [Bryobacteraceae bacterium]